MRGAFFYIAWLSIAVPVIAEEGEPETVEAVAAEQAVIVERRADEASLNEDPEAVRRAQRKAEAEARQAVSEAVAEQAADEGVAYVPQPEAPAGSLYSFDFYGSARVHAIDAFVVDTGNRESKISDGNSRIGLRAEYQFRPGWYLMGRGEIGVDVVEATTTRGDLFGDGGLNQRLLFVGVDHESTTLLIGQNWSAYYQVAGATDRFAVFGGSGSGVYNAGTAGQQSGTGRAEDVIQGRFYLNTDGTWFKRLKPFNLNVQYQLSQPIPRVPGEEYDYGYGASAKLEFQNELMIGIAYNHSAVPEGRPLIQAAGIDGDATATALTTRAYGARWYVSALVAALRNMESTDQGGYYDAIGYELYAQWEAFDNWWLIGGGNWLQPDDEDPDVGQFRTRYAVIGGRYSFDSFRRMVYFEYRLDDSRFFDGTRGKNEFTVGVRWDFGE